MTTDQLAERRFQKLVEMFVAKLSTDGAVILSAEAVASLGLPNAVDSCRRAGRAAAKQLSLPVQTGVNADGRVWIEVFDRSAEPRDQRAVDWITEVLPPASKD